VPSLGRLAILCVELLVRVCVGCEEDCSPPPKKLNLALVLLRLRLITKNGDKWAARRLATDRSTLAASCNTRMDRPHADRAAARFILAEYQHMQCARPRRGSTVDSISRRTPRGARELPGGSDMFQFAFRWDTGNIHGISPQTCTCTCTPNRLRRCRVCRLGSADASQSRLLPLLEVHEQQRAIHKQTHHNDNPRGSAVRRACARSGVCVCVVAALPRRRG
jgi:hypothetical protein